MEGSWKPDLHRARTRLGRRRRPCPGGPVGVTGGGGAWRAAWPAGGAGAGGGGGLTPATARGCGGGLGGGPVGGGPGVAAARAAVTIGERCLLADEVVLIDARPRLDDVERPVREQGLEAAPIAVGDDVRVGPAAA